MKTKFRNKYIFPKFLDFLVRSFTSGTTLVTCIFGTQVEYYELWRDNKFFQKYEDKNEKYDQ